ncbi:hypothetical protein MG293_002981 [Ovis ammon polii]|uniref:Uncharacterized protein n=1 Tax=Ovis ammon polii TaxID=230172 RepID=A0AAD4UI66_OVIAM|nr:hypothetical protein MG293_002981 [Ovis ammon polii]
MREGTQKMKGSEPKGRRSSRELLRTGLSLTVNTMETEVERILYRSYASEHYAPYSDVFKGDIRNTKITTSRGVGDCGYFNGETEAQYGVIRTQDFSCKTQLTNIAFRLVFPDLQTELDTFTFYPPLGTFYEYSMMLL